MRGVLSSNSDITANYTFTENILVLLVLLIYCLIEDTTSQELCDLLINEKEFVPPTEYLSFPQHLNVLNRANPLVGFV